MIYENRPQGCRDFVCLWLHDQDGKLPECLNPLKSHIVISQSDDGHTFWVAADPDYPDGWRKLEVMEALMHLSRCAPVLVTVKDKAFQVFQLGFNVAIRELEPSDIRDNGDGSQSYRMLDGNKSYLHLSNS